MPSAAPAAPPTWRSCTPPPAASRRRTPGAPPARARTLGARLARGRRTGSERCRPGRRSPRAAARRGTRAAPSGRRRLSRTRRLAGIGRPLPRAHGRRAARRRRPARESAGRAPRTARRTRVEHLELVGDHLEAAQALARRRDPLVELQPTGYPDAHPLRNLVGELAAAQARRGDLHVHDARLGHPAPPHARNRHPPRAPLLALAAAA